MDTILRQKWRTCWVPSKYKYDFEYKKLLVISRDLYFIRICASHMVINQKFMLPENLIIWHDQLDHPGSIMMRKIIKIYIETIWRTRRFFKLVILYVLLAYNGSWYFPITNKTTESLIFGNDTRGYIWAHIHLMNHLRNLWL